MVGEMAKTFPAEARRVKAEGHTVGTHSFQHPFTFGRMSELQAGAEIDRGIDAVAAALGSPDEVASSFASGVLRMARVSGGWRTNELRAEPPRNLSKSRNLRRTNHKRCSAERFAH